ncbi:hypothetical protein ACPXCE_00350 [Streptomyces sp. DT24]|uniref:hypothetical protein n=1 Tax=Streptomyces sp. DT24 TaxID=3416520 RepID=UPI003CE9ED52
MIGQVERDTAGFMLTRSDDDYPPALSDLLTLALARDTRGEETGTGRYPVVDVANAWEPCSMPEVTTPGVEHAYEQHGRHRTACLVHPDDSWARATA